MEQDQIQQCAGRVMETIPMVMRSIGSEMRRRSHVDLSVSQFRALTALKHHEGASLSLVAGQMGASLSSTSKLIDGLVENHLVERVDASGDRRRMALTLTVEGTTAMEGMRQEAIIFLTERLTALSSEDCRQVRDVMDLLSSLFSPPRETTVEAA